MKSTLVFQSACMGVFLFLLGLTMGCGGEDEKLSCVPGSVQNCPCPGAEDGVQNCTADEIFAPCQCEDSTNQIDPDAGIPDDADFPDPDADGPDADGPDADGPDADGPDADGPDADADETPDLNECGGQEDLLYEGEPATLTDPCGPCNDGVLTCTSPEELRCVQATEVNACGGCQILVDEPDDPCGACGDGAYQCTGEGDLACVGATDANDCGGCAALDGVPDVACEVDGESGLYQCQSPDAVICVTSGMNACGGTQTLEAPPTTSCGTCEQGSWVCDGEDTVLCEDKDAGTNECGGCSPLTHTVGDDCGDCGGQWVCDGEDALWCDDPINACGGCATLDATPGTACGDGGAWICAGVNDLSCDETLDTNACGGLDSLTDQPGEACGPCSDGEFICISLNATACMGASNLNDCGGCAGLLGKPGETCDTDSEWQCEGEDAVECVFLGEYNQCGGTAALAGEPGADCGTCGEWACAGEDAVTCEGETNTNTDPDNCGSCSNQCPIDAYCDAGTCETFNACGGTLELDGEPGTGCGDCGEWVCTGSNSVSCEGEVDLQNDPDNCGTCGNKCVINAYCDTGTCKLFNDCGGTADLPGSVGETCQDCGEWVCDGSDSVTCVGGTDTETDFFNCGECGNTCKDGEYCENWACNVDKVIQVATSSQHTCALRESGEVFCWGQGAGVLSSSITNATAITTGSGHSCALLETGQVLCWGGNFNGQLGNGDSGHGAGTTEPVMVQDLEDVTAISAGHVHTCAINDGQAYCWGRNNSGQLGDGTEEDRDLPTAVSNEMPASATDISGGRIHTCAVANEEAYCWGSTHNGQVGSGSSWGNVTTPEKVIGLPSAKTITAGYSHSCATTNGNVAYCWGRNTAGQLGDGGTQSTSSAGPVSNLGTVQKLTTGTSYSTCALRTDDRVYCWGSGRFGILGIGSTEDQSLPQPVSTLGDEVVDLNLGDRNSCAVLDNGQVACWGEARYGRLGDNQIGSWPFPRWLPVISPLIPPVTSEYGQCFTNMDSSGNGLVDCEDPDCATDLGQATGDNVASGQLEGFAGHYTQGSCGGTGPEDVYAWTAPDSGTFVFETGGQLETDAEVILYLRGSCIADELGCATDGGPDGRPRLEVEVNEGQTYYLIVDSEPSGSSLDDDGIYSLHIHPAE